jgi:hypothetical protein
LRRRGEGVETFFGGQQKQEGMSVPKIEIYEMDVNQIMNFYEILYEIYEICKPQDMKIARGPGAL